MSQLDTAIQKMKPGSGQVIVLTGAGISAESDIPTFRGPEGYWQVGSANYHPTEMATNAAFRRMPDEVWAWYLYRRGVCRNAQPNPAHHAITDLSNILKKRFLLITQNVDGLHIRANTPFERTYQIHGNIDFMRCFRECSVDIFPIPDSISVDWPKGRTLDHQDRQRLRCPKCGALARPHVLWFDEYYDEPHFRFESSIRAASTVDLLIVIGTTGGTNLPLQIGSIAVRRADVGLIVIDPEPNTFTEFATRVPAGVFIQGTAGQQVPPLVKKIAEHERG